MPIALDVEFGFVVAVVGSVSPVVFTANVVG